MVWTQREAAMRDLCEDKNWQGSVERSVRISTERNVGIHAGMKLMIAVLFMFFALAGCRCVFSPVIASAAETQSGSEKKYETVYKGQDYSRVYDYRYYCKKYPSVIRKIGNSPKKVLKNFVTQGMKKGRRGCASFKVRSYIYGNPDLRRKYGNNLKKYYLHYQNKGYKSRRRAATAVKIKKMVSPATKLDGISYAKVYDYFYYTAMHPEVKKACGYDDLAVLRHYVDHGFAQRVQAKETVSEKAYAYVEKNILRQRISRTRTAEKTNQIILVIDHTLTLWQKNAKGTWKQKLSAYCGYGKNGLSYDRYEGDNTTPIGAFPILHAFGKAANPGTLMDWKDITPNSYWSGEYSTYNTWVESPWRVSGEHLEDYYQYKYAMAIGFNRDPVVYKKGSAIFLHCKSYDHWYTGGCVSVEEEVMRKLLLKCSNGTWIIIVPNASELSSY